MIASIVLVLALSLSPFPSVAQNQSAFEEVRLRMAAAMDGFNRFQKTKSADDLNASSEALFVAMGNSDLSPSEAAQIRRQYLSDYGLLLQAIISLEDPSYRHGNPRYAVFRCMIPPAEPDGRRLGPCADPNEIHDAATRTKYLAMIATNAENEKRREREIRLRMTEGRITASLLAILDLYHSKAPHDDRALESILQKFGFSQETQALIRSRFK